MDFRVIYAKCRINEVADRGKSKFRWGDFQKILERL